MKKSTRARLEVLRSVARVSGKDALVVDLDTLVNSDNLNKQEAELLRLHEAFPNDALIGILYRNAVGVRRSCQRARSIDWRKLRGIE